MKKLIKHILDGILTLLPAIGTLASSKNAQENNYSMKALSAYFYDSPGNTKMIAEKNRATKVKHAKDFKFSSSMSN